MNKENVFKISGLALTIIGFLLVISTAINVDKSQSDELNIGWFVGTGIVFLGIIINNYSKKLKPN